MTTYIQPIKSADDVPQAILKQLDRLVLDESNRFNHICFALYRKMIVSVGRNSYSKSHPTQAKWANKVGETKKNCLHAELHCMIRARSKIDSLFVFRLNKQGKWLQSKPCKICTAAILATKILNVYHS